MSHYFATPVSDEQRRTVGVRFWDTDWTFTTANGVFSADGLDLGTAVLLRTHTPDAAARRLLDLGCGWGVLAVALAVASPQAFVDAVAHMNVKLTMEAIRKQSPILDEMISRGELGLAGAMYDVKTGEVTFLP